MDIWQLVSAIIGWVYFLAWSISFYPQAILNYHRRSVQGLSIDFLTYNVFGFACYSAFNLSFFSDEIQREYRDRNHGNSNLVRVNDVFFACHAFLISSFTLLQSFVYKRDPDQRLSHPAWLFFALASITILIDIALALTAHVQWIDLLYHLSYFKLAISVLKYVPQAYKNYQRKSTVGWSIHNILLDFTGGILSTTQLFLDSSMTGDWSGVTGNPVKFGLGLCSMTFDVLFIIQHYILYRDRHDEVLDEEQTEGEGERQRLLSDA
ncbi:hypothetical protein BZG36_03338 [Bifiguratus adelaidae]|uniref:Cystinosin n=1 Tax=Bifiguratus adelaidae TaxID=1938954 RepID=A0A261XWM7_9FUNG|nr:hypothetical protein BZG36_03338 [Bifiguratus adelaidae]